MILFYGVHFKYSRELLLYLLKMSNQERIADGLLGISGAWGLTEASGNQYASVAFALCLVSGILGIFKSGKLLKTYFLLNFISERDYNHMLFNFSGG